MAYRSGWHTTFRHRYHLVWAPKYRYKVLIGDVRLRVREIRRAKRRSSRKIQQEFEHIRKRYWGQRFGQRGYFSTTSGNITDDIIMRYPDRHTHQSGFSHSA